MWISRRRLKRDVIILSILAGLWGGVSLVTMFWPRPALMMSVPLLAVAFMLALRFLVRCPRCRQSALWWQVRHSRGREIPSRLLAMTACPYCKFDGSF